MSILLQEASFFKNAVTPSVINIYVEVTAVRASSTEIDWEVTCTLSEPAPSALTGIYVQVIKVNGYGLNWNSNPQWAIGETIANDTRNETSCNPSEFSATIQENSGFPPPAGYEFQNLPFGVLVQVFAGITGWDVSTGTYLRKEDVSANAFVPNSLVFSDDGGKMIVLDNNSDSFVEYILASEWDVSTAAHHQTVAASIGNLSGMFASYDGTRFYIFNGNFLIYFTLSTAWDTSTKTQVNLQDFSAQDSTLTDGFIEETGEFMYLTGSGNDKVYKYALLTPFDPTSAVFLNDFSVGTEETNVRSVFFRPTGRQMYIVGYTNDTVYEYHFSIAWDLSTASYASRSLPVGTQFPAGIFWRRTDGQKMYIVDANTGDKSVYEYNIAP